MNRVMDRHFMGIGFTEDGQEITRTSIGYDFGHVAINRTFEGIIIDVYDNQGELLDTMALDHDSLNFDQGE